ncbi:MAG TPA: succinate-semialdehyde dehydrogenase, partial [Flavobacteriales bacterium]|nr:succinate-semialdehyde dehydrogenase [Flavobacteriales bacterium]
MEFSTINPWNLEPIEKFNNHTDEEANGIIESVDSTFHQWKKTSFEQRSALLIKVGEVLLKNKQTYAAHITEEMGKPISESLAEVEKCAWVCKFYAENAAKFLAPRVVET